jgi:hypothetical protein
LWPANAKPKDCGKEENIMSLSEYKFRLWKNIMDMLLYTILMVHIKAF